MQVPGAAFPDRFGGSMAAAGDINGDGLGDYLIGASSTRIDGVYQSGAVYLVYGSRAER